MVFLPWICPRCGKKVWEHRPYGAKTCFSCFRADTDEKRTNPNFSFVDWLHSRGFTSITLLPDKRWKAIAGSSVVRGVQDDWRAKDELFWGYPSMADAQEAFEQWGGLSDPPKWHRHGTAVRINGDPNDSYSVL